MEVEIITLPSFPWPPLQTGPNSQKHSTENHLSKHVSKASFNNESKAKGQKTFPDTQFEKETPENYQNNSAYDSDQVNNE